MLRNRFKLATGYTLHPETNNNLDLCSVIVAGPFGSSADTTRLLLFHQKHAFLIFHNDENMESTVHGVPGPGATHDHQASNVDVIFSNAKSCLPITPTMDIAGKVAITGACTAIRTGKHLWTPNLIQYITDGDNCVIHPRLSIQSNSTEWALRPKFAILASSHQMYPRPLLFDQFSILGSKIDLNVCSGDSPPPPLEPKCGRQIDAPGSAWHNVDIPGVVIGQNVNQVANSSSQRANLRYRFALTPENSRSWTQGWMTEKIVNAHLTGQVPVYWGDPILEELWNPRRILFLGDIREFDSTEPNISSVLDTVQKLELSGEFRESFFKEPVLAPEAEQWVGAWCDASVRLLQRGFKQFQARLTTK